VGRNRFDWIRARYKDSGTMGDFLMQAYLAPMLRIYTEWRRTLALSMADFSKLNLLSVSKAELEEAFKKGLNLPEAEKAKFYDYYVASEMIWPTLVRLAALPSRQCLVIQDQKVIDHMDFEELKKRASLEGKRLEKCETPLAKSLMGVDETDASIVVISAGYNFEDHTFSQEVKDRPDWWTADVVGVKDLVESAQKALTDIDSFTKDNQEAQFYPVIMEDPRVIRLSLDLLRDRILYGIRTSELAPELKDSNEFLPIFSSTQGTSISLANFINSALQGAAKTSSASFWRAELTTYRKSQLEEVPRNAVVFHEDDSTHAYALIGNKVGSEILRKAVELKNLHQISENMNDPRGRTDFKTLREKVLKLIQDNQKLQSNSVRDISVEQFINGMKEVRELLKTNPMLDFTLKEAFTFACRLPVIWSGILGNEYPAEYAKMPLSAYLQSLGLEAPEGSSEQLVDAALARVDKFNKNRTEFLAQAQTIDFFGGTGFVVLE
jgi:hypothetical protein